jgi:hypothetical protein
VKDNLTPPGRCPSPVSLAGARRALRLRKSPMQAEGDVTLPDFPRDSKLYQNNGEKVPE